MLLLKTIAPRALCEEEFEHLERPGDRRAGLSRKATETAMLPLIAER
jgi:hypothetical protein